MHLGDGESEAEFTEVRSSQGSPAEADGRGPICPRELSMTWQSVTSLSCGQLGLGKKVRRRVSGDL